MGFDTSWAALIGTVAVGATVSVGTRFADDTAPIQSISGGVPLEVYQGDDNAGQQDQGGVVFESGTRDGYSGEVQWSERDYDTWDGDDEPINSRVGVSQLAGETASDESILTEENEKRPYFDLGRRNLRVVNPDGNVSGPPEASSSEFTWTEGDEQRLSYVFMLYLDGDEEAYDEVEALVAKRERLVKEHDNPNGKPGGDEEPQDQRTPGRQGFLQAIDAAADD